MTNRKALVIGINNYPAPIPSLYGCINDANEVAEILSKNGDGTPNFDVLKNVNVGTKATLKANITRLFDGDCETATFFYSGHGFINELGGYLVTPDTKKYDEGVSLDEILVIANQSKAKNKIIILDCCFAGAIGSLTISGNRHTHIGEGVTILTASKESETSVEVNGHGVFTNLLVEALRGGAADIRGHVSPSSIYSYIDQALGPWEQRPVFKTNVSRFTSLRTINPLVPFKVLRNLTQYFSEPGSRFDLNPSFEDTNSPAKVPLLREPYSTDKNTAVFKHLQKMQSVGLIKPVGEDHMYFAAMNSKSCELTPLGKHYWRLVKDGRI